MINEDFDGDGLDRYEQMFDPLQVDRQARRKRKPKAVHRPKKTKTEVLGEIAAPTGIEAGFAISYEPTRHERGWLLDALKSFYEEDLIGDVEARVRGGKEASVYRCAGTKTSGKPHLAAKVYRPRMFRNLRNDRMYRQGRGLLASDGSEIRANDDRVARAVGKKSAFGEQVSHMSWMMYEYQTLAKLHAAGAKAPAVYGVSDNAILMDYIGDEAMAAPTLNTVRLEPAEAQYLYEVTLGQIELMLAHDVIHGDLSAYNILYWEGDVVVIDFPQVTNPYHNPDAREILMRDVERVASYFQAQGARVGNPRKRARAYWERYFAPRPEDILADKSRGEEEDG